MERKREWNFWMKVGEEHLGDWVGGLCTKPISRRRRKKEKEKKKRRQPAWNETFVNSFFSYPTIGRQEILCFIIVHEEEEEEKERDDQRETNKRWQIVSPLSPLPSSIFFQSRQQRSVFDRYRRIFSIFSSSEIEGSFAYNARNVSRFDIGRIGESSDE